MNNIISTSPTTHSGTNNGTIKIKATSVNNELSSVKKKVIIKGNGVDPVVVNVEQPGVDSILSQNNLIAGQLYLSTNVFIFRDIADRASLGVYDKICLGNIHIIDAHDYARIKSTPYGDGNNLNVPKNKYQFAILNGNIPAIDQINANEGISKYIYKYKIQGTQPSSYKEPLDNNKLVWFAKDTTEGMRADYYPLFFINGVSDFYHPNAVTPTCGYKNISLAEYLPFFGTKCIACTQDLINNDMVEDNIKYKASVYVVIGRTQQGLPDTTTTTISQTPLSIFDKMYIFKSTMIDVYKYQIKVYVNGQDKSSDLTNYVTLIGPSGTLYAKDLTTYQNLLHTKNGKLVCDDVYILCSRCIEQDLMIRKPHEIVTKSNYYVDNVTVTPGDFFNKCGETFETRFSHPIDHLQDWYQQGIDVDVKGNESYYDRYNNEDLYQFDLGWMISNNSELAVASEETITKMRKGWSPDMRYTTYPYIPKFPTAIIKIYLKSK